MPAPITNLQSVNLHLVGDAVTRLQAAKHYLDEFEGSQNIAAAESSVLQLRKALESIAFAAIAPNKASYEAFRAKAEEQPDFTKDYNAKKILRTLAKINKNFYPLPLIPATQQPDGKLHFERKATGYLTKKRFESIYDQLGKHLHSSNPWDTNKNIQNLVADLPTIIIESFALLELHATFIQTPEFTGVWVVEARNDGTGAKIVTGESDGEFVVQDA